MIIGAEYNEEHQSLMISYYNEKGEVEFLKKKLHKSDLYNWTISKNPTPDKNWDGRYVRRSDSKGRWLSQYRIQEIMQDKLSIEELNRIYSLDHFPKKSYLDIEIELIDESFPDPGEARMPVNMITFCNEKNIVYVLTTMKEEDGSKFTEQEWKQMHDEVHDYFGKIEPLKPEDSAILNQKFELKYIPFDTEEEMMSFFFHRILPKMALITGWNVINFDWVYLMNRCKRLDIDPFLTLMSDAIVSKRTKIPIHVGVLDYMEVMQQHKPLKVIENFRLDYISKLILNAGKLQTDYDSMMAAQKDVFNFTKYNIIDVVLVKMLDDKLSLLDVALSISGVAQIDVNKVYSPVYITEILMCREFLKKGLKMAKDGGSPATTEQTTYAGAYVAAPTPGHYDLVACYDFASMYPNIQMQFNISPDSYIGRIGTVPRRGDEIFTKNETLFNKGFDGVAKTILDRLYNERVATKSKMKKMKKS
jgi:DNA polymerase elongation subunit (family B)